MFYSILFLLLISYLAWYIYTRFYVYQKNTHIPGPSFFKSFKVMIPVRPESIIQYIRENKLYQDFMGGWIGHRYVVFAVDPEAAKFVLKDPRFRKSSATLSAKQKEYFGQNIAVMDGDDWRRHRSIISCGFTNQALSGYFSSFLEMTDKAIQYIPPDKDFETTDFFSRFTLDILGKTLFNHDFRRIEGHNDKYYSAYKSLFELLDTHWPKLMLLTTWANKLPVKPIQNYLNGIDTLVAFFRELIKEHRDKNDNSVLSKLLIASDNPDLLTENELLANIYTFFIAGHETTATALVWALNCLRIYPDIQEKIYEEINSVIGDKVPTEEELDKLVYLDCFIQEVMRLHSPVPALASRDTTEDVKYKDMIIPKGTRVGIHFHILHTNPNYWDDPEKFDPGRFSVENRKGRNHFSHIPFSAGMRQCIGNTFSLVEQRLFLTRLLQKYRVVEPKDTIPFPENKLLSFSKKNNVTVRFEKR